MRKKLCGNPDILSGDHCDYSRPVITQDQIEETLKGLPATTYEAKVLVLRSDGGSIISKYPS